MDGSHVDSDKKDLISAPGDYGYSHPVPPLSGFPPHHQDVVLPPIQEEAPPDTIVYKERFYILVMYSLLAMVQGGVWNTWGPIAQSSKSVFGWTDADIALLANWGPITYVISTVFFSWLMDVKGLRWACLVTAYLVAMGCGLRCITPSQPAASWLMHLGQALNGFGGPVAMGAPPLLSAVWFPVHERTTSTAFGNVLNGFGVAVSFIIGPLLVPDPSNATAPVNQSLITESANSQNITNIPDMTDRIMKLMYIEFGFSAILFLVMLIYFPARPKTPPSITASEERTGFKQGLKDLFRHPKFWMLSLPYALSSGVYSCWGSVLDVNLHPLGIKEETAGLIGFYGVLASTAAGLIVARFADIFTKRMKTFLIILFTLGAIALICFAVVCQGFFKIPFHTITVALYISNIMASMCLGGAVPLFYELVCESCYPIAEGLTNGFLTWLNNVTGLLFLFVLMAKQYIGTLWMNWCVVVCTAVSIPVLMFFKERYQRFDIDTSKEENTNTVN